MCWDDQKRARNLQTRPHVVPNGELLTIPPNPGRVALIITGGIGGGTVGVVSPTDGVQAPIAIVTDQMPTVIMRIIDYGQGVTQGLKIDATTSATIIGVTETIISEPYP